MRGRWPRRGICTWGEYGNDNDDDDDKDDDDGTGSRKNGE